MKLITFWIDVEDLTEKNGVMKFLPGSHKLCAKPSFDKWMVWKQKDKGIQKDLINNKKKISICLKAGSLFFSS